MSPVFPPNYPEEYLRCLAYLHAWELWRARVKAGHLSQALWCSSCTAERFDEYGPANNLESRRYTYPEGYHVQGYNMAEMRHEARLELARRRQVSAKAPARDPVGWKS